MQLIMLQGWHGPRRSGCSLDIRSRVHLSQVFQLHDLLNANLPAFVRSTHVDALSLAHSRNFFMVIRKVAEVSERSSLVLQMASFFKALAQPVLLLAHCLCDEADADRVTTATAVLSDPMLPVKADAQASPQSTACCSQVRCCLPMPVAIRGDG